MPGPRRTLAALLGAAVVGLFLVAGVGVAQAAPAQRATTVQHTTASHQAASVKASGDHTHQVHLDLWAVPVDAPTLPSTEPGVVDDHVAVTAPTTALHGPDVRGPPAA
jgi:hypothetical protein